MGADSVEALKDVAKRDSRLWRRLREIHERGHLATVSLDKVRQYAADMGLDPDALVVDKKLVFDAANRFPILQLLNEDLYHGFLTDDPFEAQRKTGL